MWANARREGTGSKARRHGLTGKEAGVPGTRAVGWHGDRLLGATSQRRRNTVFVRPVIILGRHTRVLKVLLHADGLPRRKVGRRRHVFVGGVGRKRRFIGDAAARRGVPVKKIR